MWCASAPNIELPQTHISSWSTSNTSAIFAYYPNVYEYLIDGGIFFLAGQFITDMQIGEKKIVPCPPALKCVYKHFRNVKNARVTVLACIIYMYLHIKFDRNARDDMWLQFCMLDCLQKIDIIRIIFYEHKNLLANFLSCISLSIVEIIWITKKNIVFFSFLCLYDSYDGF